MGWSLGYLCCLSATLVTMELSGVGAGSWQWWVILISVVSSNVFGRAREGKL